MNEIPPIFFILGGLFALFFLWRITQPTSELKAPAEPSAMSDYVTQLVGREAGTFRLNPPHDGGCRHGYCYACGNKVGVLDTNDPTLPRDDTYWFCSSYCYNRMLNGYVPLEFRGEYTATYYYVDEDDLDQQKRNARIKADYHYEMQKKFLRAAAPRLLNVLEQIEREEPARVAKLEEEKRASYKHPDPPDQWKPLYDPPVIRSIKRPSPDRCIHCGKPHRRSQSVLVEDTPFWFCDECSFKAIQEFVPKRWLLGAPDDVE